GPAHQPVLPRCRRADRPAAGPRGGAGAARAARGRVRLLRRRTRAPECRAAGRGAAGPGLGTQRAPAARARRRAGADAWSGEKPPYGFSTAAKTWLPAPDGWADLTVEAQLEDPHSTLSLYRRALELRHDHPGFGGPGLEWFTGPEGCLAFRRPGGLLCAL